MKIAKVILGSMSQLLLVVTLITRFSCNSCEINLREFGLNLPGWLIDDDMSTCNPKLTEKTITVSFSTSFVFSWLRLASSTKSFVKNFEITFNNNTAKCINKRIFYLSPNVVDISCKLMFREDNIFDRDRVDSIEITGLAVSHLCNVFVGNESSCPVNKWGIGCSKYCNCSRTQTCFYITGVCAEGCPPGLYGYQCSKTCHRNCYKDGCHDITGHCFECIHGFYGNHCSTPCPKSCDHSNCNLISGACLSCSSGLYGYNCSQKCPLECGNPICDITTGSCFSCNRGYYDHTCSYSCSKTCLHGICVFESGSCLTCTAGFFGNLCENSCSLNCSSHKCNATSGYCTEGAVGPFPFSKIAPFLIGFLLWIAIIVFLLYDRGTLKTTRSVTPHVDAAVVTLPEDTAVVTLPEDTAVVTYSSV